MGIEPPESELSRPDDRLRSGGEIGLRHDSQREHALRRELEARDLKLAEVIRAAKEREDE